MDKDIYETFVKNTNNNDAIENNLKEKLKQINEKKQKQHYNKEQKKLNEQDKLIQNQQSIYLHMKEKTQVPIYKVFLDFLKCFINQYEKSYAFSFKDFRNIKKHVLKIYLLNQ